MSTRGMATDDRRSETLPSQCYGFRALTSQRLGNEASCSAPQQERRHSCKTKPTNVEEWVSRARVILFTTKPAGLRSDREACITLRPRRVQSTASRQSTPPSRRIDQWHPRLANVLPRSVSEPPEECRITSCLSKDKVLKRSQEYR